MPLLILYRFADLLYFLAWYVVRYRKALVLQGLRTAFPHKTEAQLQAIAKASYRNLFDVFVEVVKGMSIGAAQLRRRVSVQNPQVVTDYLRNDQPVLLLAAHFCNWEWLLLASCLHLGPLDAVYKPLKHRDFDRLLLDMRTRFGATLIPVQDFLLETVRRRSLVRAVAMVTDQAPHQEQEKLWLNFLGQPTAFHPGVDKIARIVRYPVVFVHMHRVSRGYYRIVLKRIAEPPYAQTGQQVAEAYVRELESQVSANPENWLWVYERWRYKPTLYG